MRCGKAGADRGLDHRQLMKPLAGARAGATPARAVPLGAINGEMPAIKGQPGTPGHHELYSTLVSPRRPRQQNATDSSLNSCVSRYSMSNPACAPSPRSPETTVIRPFGAIVDWWQVALNLRRVIMQAVRAATRRRRPAHAHAQERRRGGGHSGVERSGGLHSTRSLSSMRAVDASTD